MTGLKWLDALLLLAAFLVGVLTGREQIQDKRDLDQANWERDKAKAVATAESAIREQLEGAIRMGDTLTDQLIKAETDLKKTTQEKNRAIQNLTTGRACLDADVVGLLNQSADTTAHGIKPTAKAPGLPYATNEAFATDTDVGTWIGFAQGEYDTCRARLDALIDFEEQIP